MLHLTIKRLLFASRQGRDALGRHQLRAVRWSVLPLLAGLAFLVLWATGGAKSTPVAAIGLLCAATLLHEGFSNRHPWVRRRLLLVAGIACGAAVWFLLGPGWLLGPVIADIASLIAETRKSGDRQGLPPELTQRLKEMLQLNQRAFAYPALGLYLLTAFSDKLAEALTRRAPDESD